MIMLKNPSQPLSLVKRFTATGTTGGIANSSSRVLSSGFTAATEYGMTAVYQQARVLSMRVSFSVPYSNATFVVAGTDRTGTLAGAQTPAVVWALQNAKAFNGLYTGKSLIQYTAKATDFEDQNFDPIGAPVSRFGIHLVSNSATALTYLIEWEVELRGTI